MTSSKNLVGLALLTGEWGSIEANAFDVDGFGIIEPSADERLRKRQARARNWLVRIVCCRHSITIPKTTVDLELLEERRLNPEWLADPDLIDICIVESCEAEWAHPTEKDSNGTPYYLRCMEPSVYYIQVQGNVIIGSRYFCKFHRPSVRSV